MSSYDKSQVFPMVCALTAVASFVPDDAISDRFANDLSLIYYVETNQGRVFVNADVLDQLGLAKYELLLEALKNLQERIGKVERIGRGPTFLLRANGKDEACLMVLDQFWESIQKEVEGELLVAVPAQACILFTGSKSKTGLVALRAAVRAMAGSGDLKLSDNIYVRRQARWHEFGDDVIVV